MNRGYKPQMIALYRSPIARLTAKKNAALYLLEQCKKENPYISDVKVDESNQVEHWWIEKQFWLKHKIAFQEFGYLPLIRMNEIKKVSHMMEPF